MNIFAKIIEGRAAAEKVFENEWVLAIKDHAPVAPVHILIMPKKGIRNLQDLEIEKDGFLILEMLRVAKELAEQFNITEGYRLITNNGESAGQTVFHFHFHLIGGKKLGALLSE